MPARTPRTPSASANWVSSTGDEPRRLTVQSPRPVVSVGTAEPVPDANPIHTRFSVGKRGREAGSRVVHVEHADRLRHVFDVAHEKADVERMPRDVVEVDAGSE